MKNRIKELRDFYIIWISAEYSSAYDGSCFLFYDKYIIGKKKY